MSKLFPLADTPDELQDVADAFNANCVVVFNFREIQCGIPDGRNWLMEFPNGYTLSIRQGGEGSYSDDETVELLAYSNDVFDAPDTWTRERGWQDRDAMISAMVEVSAYPNVR